MLAFHPWTNVGGRIPAEICMHADMFAVLRPRPLPSPFSFNHLLVRYGDDRRNSGNRADFVFSFDISERKVRRPGRPGGGWSEGGDTNICSSGFAGFEILTNPGWILSVIVDRNCFSSK